MANENDHVEDEYTGAIEAMEKGRAEKQSPKIDYTSLATANLIHTLVSMIHEGKDIKLSQGSPIGCEICGKTPARQVRLVGEYDTVLCNFHSNGWHVYCQNSIEKQALENTNIRLQIAIRQGNEAAALGLSAGMKSASLALHSLAQAWVFDEFVKLDAKKKEQVD